MIRAPRHLGFLLAGIVPAVVLSIAVAGAADEAVAPAAAKTVAPATDGIVAHSLLGMRTTYSGSETSQDSQRQIVALLELEDARPTTKEGQQPLVQGLKSEDPLVRAIAVRALGRLERIDLVLTIAEVLAADESPFVRTEAANALAQAAYRGGAHAAAIPLLARIPDEEDPAVRGAIAQALGRLVYTTAAEVKESEAAILGLAADAPPVTLLGVAQGLESLARQQPAETPLSAAAVARLRGLATYDGSAEVSSRSARTLGAARVRRLALAALTAAGDAEPAVLKAAGEDADEEVRRLAAAAVANLTDTVVARELNSYGLRDSSPHVRYQALATYGQTLQKSMGCGPIVVALDDRDAHVALQAIDLLGGGCSDRTDLEEMLIRYVKRGEAAQSDPDVLAAWHRPAHALEALSRIQAETAAVALPHFVSNPVWQVRMYAARAAANLQAVSYLETLARDSHPNVRQTAIRALSAQRGHADDSIFVAALASNDPQLLMAASGALEGSRDPEALPALIAALERVTALQRQTSRDARRALINRVGELGGANLTESLLRYVNDFDPVIAEAAARILTAWTETPHQADPRLLPRQPFPEFLELLSLVGARVRIEMEEGGTIELRLFPFEAPTNAARFARLARAGYYDGLTFHRVVPNFVIQGGSPGANEFWGDGPFTRDEISARSNLSGTVGISTRGRDTGDAQIFVNLVDNVRLDHNFTLFGEVVSGMDVVDAALEGATMKSVTIEEGAG
jgi:cyclophilin family peptidyl-prolyl cis-trans isomerase/HEAT repeat protein